MIQGMLCATPTKIAYPSSPLIRAARELPATSPPLPFPQSTDQPEELAQRCRIILDVSTADLETAETLLGSFHPSTEYFRDALQKARRSWERLRAELGGKALAEALESPPQAVLALGKNSAPSPQTFLIVISGQTYCAQAVPGSRAASIIWRLSRLPDLEDGPYHACRLEDGSFQCDCAQWTYQIADNEDAGDSSCKHVSALQSLGWI